MGPSILRVLEDCRATSLESGAPLLVPAEGGEDPDFLALHSHPVKETKQMSKMTNPDTSLIDINA
jgi:hypothetical protein